MHNRATSIASEIAVLDEKIRMFRHEISQLQEMREALVGQLAAAVDVIRPVRIFTPLGEVSVKRKRVVSFPTQSTDPVGQKQLVSMIRERGACLRYSMINYPRLKSDWLNGQVEVSIRDPLRPLVIEQDELVVMCPRRSAVGDEPSKTPGRTE